MKKLTFFIASLVSLSVHCSEAKSADVSAERDQSVIVVDPEQYDQTFKPFSAVRQEWVESDHTIEGWDYSLPDYVEPSKKAFVFMPKSPNASDPKFPGRLAKRISIAWNEIEPEDGVYKFDVIEDAIEDAVADGYEGVGVCIMVNVLKVDWFKKIGGGELEYTHTQEGTAPKWLLERGVPSRKWEVLTSIETPFQIENMEFYDPAFSKYYLRLLGALRDSKVLNSDRVAFIYFGMPSKSRGEEGFPPPSTDPDWKVFESYADAWADCAGKSAWKVVVPFKGEGLKTTVEKGFGQRSGFIENYMGLCDMPSLGLSVNAEGYMEVNENYAPIKEGRVWGDENEEYSKVWIDRFGPYNTFPHRYHESSLRVLQMRRTYVWETGGSFDPHLQAYVALSLARTIEDTPDVWCYLREGDYGVQELRTVKNFERWLLQRDKPGAVAERARKFYSGLYYLPAEDKAVGPFSEVGDIDWIARHGEKIGFYIDEKFLTSKRYAVKVTYYDTGALILKFNSKGGAKSYDIKGSGDGKLKTTTVLVEGIAKSKNSDDFDIWLESDGSVDVSFLRVVKYK